MKKAIVATGATTGTAWLVWIVHRLMQESYKLGFMNGAIAARERFHAEHVHHTTIAEPPDHTVN